MKHDYSIILLLLSLLCFLLATIGVRSRINLVALGLFFWVVLRGFSTVFA